MATKDISDRQVLEAYVEKERRYKAGEPKFYVDALLEQMTGQPNKVCYRAMERAFHHGLLDYGVWLRGAWLTDAGKALLDTKI